MKTLNIIKIGGNVIDSEKDLNVFLEKFSSIDGFKILVHGGGNLATELGEKLKIPSKMIQGRRVTDKPTLEIVTMVYAGLINKNIVAKLQSNSCNALGLSGADANCIPSKKRNTEKIDFGFVGDIETKEISISHIELFLEQGLTPVFCAITHDKKGNLLNINADTVAAELSVALTSKFNVTLTYCFEKKGVLKNIKDEDSLIQNISAQTFAELKSSGKISKGMIPKLDNAFYALNKGVKSVKIGFSGKLKQIIEGKENVATEIIS